MRCHALVAACSFALAVPSVLAQTYPSKPVRVVVAFPAAAFPGVPPIAETLPGFEYSGYLGLYGQAAMPREIVAQIQRDVSRVLAMPDLQERMAASGFEPPNTSADQFPARYQRDIATFIKVVKDANIPQQE